VHALWTQTASAWPTVVVQGLPQSWQLLRSLVVSTHASLHSVGVAAGQLGTQE
jgi:hypothetical protein